MSPVAASAKTLLYGEEGHVLHWLMAAGRVSTSTRQAPVGHRCPILAGTCEGPEGVWMSVGSLCLLQLWLCWPDGNL